MGDNYSVAWRQSDAQFWGVPQRRNRIYLVADFADWCAGKILFESEGLSGYSKESTQSWQSSASAFREGTQDAGMGAIEMGLNEDELQPLVYAWRNSNPAITMLWWDIDNCVKETVKKRITTETHGIRFMYESGFLFIVLPSGRRLAYVKPKMGVNQFGGASVTYEGVGGTKKWERLESYGPKFCENITQAIARDILMYAMQTLKNCNIVAHVHDEVIIECRKDMSLNAVCEQMGRTPPWAKGLLLRADGYECQFYKKD